MPLEEKYIIENNSSRNEIDELISVPPGCLLHSGIMMVGLVLVVLMALACFINYPDKIIAEGVLTSESPPIEHFTEEGGILENLYVLNGESIERGDNILYIQNSANRNHINELEKAIREIASIKYIPNFLKLELNKSLELGELQTNYARLELIINGFKTSLKESSVFKQIAALKEEINKNSQEHDVLSKELQLSGEELSLQKKNLDRHQKLLNDGVISDEDFENIRLGYLSVKKQNNNLSKGLIQNEIRSEKSKIEIHKLTEERHTLVNDYVYRINEVLSQLEQQIREWRNVYFIKASIKGKVVLPSDVIQNSTLKRDQLVATIIPAENVGNHFARVVCPQKGIGKIISGQRAILKFEGYPHKEFGIVQSQVAQISLIPIKNNEESSTYEVRIPLESRVITNYNKEIPYKPNTALTAEIITQSRSIVDRIFEQFLNLIKQ